MNCADCWLFIVRTLISIPLFRLKNQWTVQITAYYSDNIFQSRLIHLSINHLVPLLMSQCTVISSFIPNHIFFVKFKDRLVHYGIFIFRNWRQLECQISHFLLLFLGRILKPKMTNPNLILLWVPLLNFIPREVQKNPIHSCFRSFLTHFIWR